MIQVELMTIKELQAEIDSLAQFKVEITSTAITSKNPNGHPNSSQDMLNIKRLAELEKEMVKRCMSGETNL